MTTINVALSTSKYSLIEDPIKYYDIPICSASFCVLDTFEPSMKEAFDHRWSQMCLRMAQTVIIDSKNRSIYIGESPKSDEGSLVDYEERIPDNEAALHFFKRWDEIKVLIFEFVVKDKYNKTAFCLKGGWHIDKWRHLEIIPTENITVI